MSIDYEQGDTDPTPPPFSSNAHGTQVAGIAAARDLNDVGGRGVAPQVRLAGYNLLWSDLASTTDAYRAMTGNGDAAAVAVSNNSWGSGTDGTGVAEPLLDSLWQEGVALGVANGRNGKGTVYLWAAGNGGESGVDNSNYDYQANNRHVLAVCAVDGDGVRTPYSEPGANLWLCAPGGYYNGLTTTDLMGSGGENRLGITDDYSNRNYTKLFAGTSAATPIISGVVALMLEANPDLGWRDVRLILAETARKNDASDSGWSVTAPASGQPQYHINHKYGFGVVDAAAAVAKARGWSNVGAQLQRQFSLPPGSAITIPDNILAGIAQSVAVDAAQGLIIEYVEVEVNIVHGHPGDLTIILQAPSGTESVLAETHACATITNTCPTTNYTPWTFGSSRHLGEGAAGNWGLTVADRRASNSGSLISWKLRLYGRQQ
jgi:kexin